MLTEVIYLCQQLISLRLAIESKGDIDLFYSKLYAMMLSVKDSDARKIRGGNVKI